MTERPEEMSLVRRCPNPGGWVVAGSIVVAVWRIRIGQAIGLDTVAMLVLGLAYLAADVYLRRTDAAARRRSAAGPPVEVDTATDEPDRPATDDQVRRAA